MNVKTSSLFAILVLLAACEPAMVDSKSGSLTGGGDIGAGAGRGSIPGQAVPGTQQDLVVNVGDRVFFGTDKFDLTPEARATLDRQAQWMQQYRQVTVTIEGHADERGTREYNLGLGERRANTVQNYLVASGVNQARVKILSFGKERPAVVGANEASWAQNRRGVTIVD